jgi:hypothetical protein
MVRRVVLCLALSLALPAAVRAAPAPQRTRFLLPTSNGHGAALIDLKQARLVQFREHVFAAEEPVIDEQGADVWDGEQFGTVHTRDLLFDAYFGVRAEGEQLWLTAVPVDEDASGYLGLADDEVGGTGIAAMVQQLGALRATTYVWTPQALAAGSFVLALKLENTGGQPLAGVQAFSLHNFHLGSGRPKRPWEVPNDIGANGETIEYDGGGGAARFRERGFAGVIVTRALGAVAHRGVGPGANLFALVDDGAPVDFPDNAPPPNAVDDAVSGFQWNVGALAPGAVRWAGIAVVHHPDPFAGPAAQADLDAFVAGASADALLAAERAWWSEFQAGLQPPEGLSADEATLVRHGAAMLHMGQVREDRYYLREWLSQDGEPRRSRFAAALPAEAEHRGEGAVLASLPPGEWTYAWIRDGAYATAAMAALGMHEHARAALRYYLEAEAGRFQSWSELAPYAMPPYQISLVRYHGFGVEETDFNAYGPNLEFDGFGLFLWALRAYESLSGDTSIADEYWPTIRDRVADVIVALREPDSGLLFPDSSIWETHWLGRERHFAYTNITAARGLCDAAAIAERLGEAERAQAWRDAAEGIRAAIAERLRDGSGAIAASTEELAAGEGYWDAAVLDALAMGLFDPAGEIAAATLAGLDEHLRVDAGPGWSRNDDRWDHANAEDLSPWGGEYDSAEWVITDLRGAVALRAAGEPARADALTEWVLQQSLTNYLMVAETYDEVAGTYKFNTPMLGFGAGAFALALAHRAGGFADPACGAYFDEGEPPATTGDESTGEPTTGAASTGEPTGAPPTSSSTSAPGPGSTGEAGGGESSGTPLDDGAGGCACRSEGAALALWWFAPLLARRRRRA